MGWVVNATPRLLYPQERDPAPTVDEPGWAPGPVQMGTENVTHTRNYIYTYRIFVR